MDPRNTHERLLAIVPCRGSGTFADPVRPMFAPLPDEMNPASATGIIAYSFVVSDDGKFALVEFVARTPQAFQAILASKDASVQSFSKGKAKKEDIEAAFKKYKKDFDFNNFGTRMP